MSHREVDTTMEKPPKSLFKYYAPSGIVDTIDRDTIKWELPCDENDPFEALACGWDEEVLAREIVSCQGLCEAFLNGLFKSQKIQEKISHVVAFVSFAERNNNILMWSHYADKYKGACIEFDTNIIEKTIDKLKRVDYAKDECEVREKIPLPHDSLGDFSDEYQNRVRRSLSYKAKEWAYEEEWRLIVPPMAKCMTSLRLDKENRSILISRIPQGAIKTLIFGYNMPVSNRLALAKRILVNHPRCEFAEVVPDKDRFLLHVEPLDIKGIEPEGKEEVQK